MKRFNSIIFSSDARTVIQYNIEGPCTSGASTYNYSLWGTKPSWLNFTQNNQTSTQKLFSEAITNIGNLTFYDYSGSLCTENLTIC